MPAAVEFPRFSGLSLRPDAQEVPPSAAIDMADVELDADGRLRSRDGYAKWTAAANAYNFVSASAYNGTTNQMVATEDSPGVRAYDSTGVAIGGAAATWAASGSTGWASFAQIGTASASYLYIANGRQTLWRWDGTNFTQPAGFAAPVTVDGSLIAVQPQDNRLVCAAPQSNFSRVLFSDAGAPETFGVNNWVDLTPNDGEGIRSLCGWGDYLFAFKRTKFFVFTGNSTDGTGQPVFNYRTVNTGVGSAGVDSVAVAPEGVYFLAEDGIYLTNGGAPTKVSGALDPFFKGVTHPYFPYVNARDSVAAAGAISMVYVNGRLFIRGPFSTAAAPAVLVYEPSTGIWLYWTVPLGSFVTFRTLSTDAPKLLFNLGHRLYQFGSSYTTDDGSAISGKWRSGFWNPGGPGTEAWIREWLIDGYGSVTVKTSVNDAATLGTGYATTLGTAPAIAQGRDRRGLRARNVSFELSGSAPWSVSRMTAMDWAQSAPARKAA